MGLLINKNIFFNFPMSKYDSKKKGKYLMKQLIFFKFISNKYNLKNVGCNISKTSRKNMNIRLFDTHFC